MHPLLHITGVPAQLPDSIASPAAELKALKTMSLDDLINRLVSDLVEFAIHLAIAIVVFYVGKFIIRKLYHITASVLLRRKVETSLSTFVLSLVRIVLYFILIVTVIGILGINTSSFIAIFASVGVAIGMALSGTLQNFAGGVLILLLKPYRIKDTIEAQGYTGTVAEIQIFSTIIRTPDNKSIIIPNGPLSTGIINNWTTQTYRRVQWEVGISYGDSFETASKAIHSILNTEPGIIDRDGNYITSMPETDAPAPAQEQIADSGESEEKAEEQPVEKKHKSRFLGFIMRQREKRRAREAQQQQAAAQLTKPPLKDPEVLLNALADSSVNIIVRAWVHTDDYWKVYHNVMERLYVELPQKGVSFPFPQMDVHLFSQK